MALSLQKNGWVLRILIKKYQVVYPVPKFRKLPSVFGCFIFTTSYQNVKSGDPKAIPPATTSVSSIERDKIIRENKAGKSHYSPRPLNLFAAGASRKRSRLQKSLASIESPAISLKTALRPPENPLSAVEWEKLKAESKEVNNFEHFMLSQMITYNSPIEVAKSLLAAIANRDGDISYALLVKYLVLCSSQKQTKEIYEIYDVMRARFKTFEPSCSTLFIKSFSQSERWREALRILEDMKRILTPSKTNYGDCIYGALINQEKRLACELFHEMTANNVIPNLDVLQFFFESGKGTKDDYFKSELIQILFYLRDNEIYPGEALMLSIKEWFESLPGENWKGNLTTIRNSGQCPSCNQTLESINLSPEEYCILKERIIKDVIEGTDTFRKTTPEELEEFQTFVNQHSPFDFVIDGLNVGKTFTKYYPSQILMDVVEHLSQQNQQVLVLGRKHMQYDGYQWKSNHMAAIRKKANFFFTDNVSEDDPFVLYATLHSGSHCRFLTRDLLRDHKACLSDNYTKRLFFKWQRGHQMAISKYIPGKSVKFEHILQYDTIIQTTGKTWHIPYDDKFSERSSYEVPTKWLCLQQNVFSTD